MFAVDVFSSFVVLVSICFYPTVFYSTRGHELFFCLFFLSAMIILKISLLTVTLNSRKTNFKFSIQRAIICSLIGFFFQIVYLKVAPNKYTVLHNYYFEGLAFFLISIYFSLDLYFQRKFKSKSLDEGYPVQSFYCLWTDIFLFFWLDLVIRIKSIKITKINIMETSRVWLSKDSNKEFTSALI